jgi:extradiol dioxygenase family protein
MKLTPFHLAVPVHDLTIARKFYGEVMGCAEGRSSDHWVDFDFFGHQFVIHEVKSHKPTNDANAVDGHNVPVPHFGVVLSWEDWEALVARMKGHGMKFEIEPYIRFKGLPGEQATMFFKWQCTGIQGFQGYRSVVCQVAVVLPATFKKPIVFVAFFGGRLIFSVSAWIISQNFKFCPSVDLVLFFCHCIFDKQL